MYLWEFTPTVGTIQRNIRKHILKLCSRIGHDGVEGLSWLSIGNTVQWLHSIYWIPYYTSYSQAKSCTDGLYISFMNYTDRLKLPP